MKIILRGKTRIVVLAGGFAIKIARIRFIRTFFRALAFSFMSEANHSRFFKRYGYPFSKGIGNYLIHGLHANRNEFDHYQLRKDVRVVPTIASYAYGWIIIQPLGEKVSAEDLASLNPFSGLPVNPDFLERDQPWQFCKLNGRILLADYGRKETRQALEQTLHIAASK